MLIFILHFFLLFSADENSILACYEYSDKQSMGFNTICYHQDKNKQKHYLQRLKKTINGNETIVMKDLGSSGKMWVEKMQVRKCYSNLECPGEGAIEYCESQGFTLPSAYPKSYAGIFGNPKEYSDFSLADKRGLRSVMKDMQEKDFWSKSEHAYYKEFAYYFSGLHGIIEIKQKPSCGFFMAI